MNTPPNRYSIEARYPGGWEPIDETEARAAFVMAAKVRGVAGKILKPALSI